MKRQTKPAPKPRLLLRIMCAGGTPLGPGRVELLELLEQTGSISEAARKMRISYMKAWLLTKSMKPVVEISRGGARGGGVRLTEKGRRAIALFRQMENASVAACGPAWIKLRRLLLNGT